MSRGIRNKERKALRTRSPKGFRSMLLCRPVDVPNDDAKDADGRFAVAFLAHNATEIQTRIYVASAFQMLSNA